MKAQLKGKIVSLDKALISGNSNVKLTVVADGKVATTNMSAQEISFNGVIALKTLIADEMKFGATITITITDEESE